MNKEVGLTAAKMFFAGCVVLFMVMFIGAFTVACRPETSQIVMSIEQ